MSFCNCDGSHALEVSLAGAAYCWKTQLILPSFRHGSLFAYHYKLSVAQRKTMHQPFDIKKGEKESLTDRDIMGQMKPFATYLDPKRITHATNHIRTTAQHASKSLS